ncbi:winged helix-turn-helix domain-containing protein [Vibrio sinaloensis]|uniref:winged helix-turn-helix domain-containing protein n=1 Tax=Photobacterium sp. (strain ATCC 43367) TaxID=379097 RepID=UPI002069E3E3|nr:transcriptional regulator [Vibrio sinaloensis]UPQ88641.1 transcriptional regulator [Vibrio sinaloensis]
MSNIGTKFNLANRFTFDPNTNSLTDRESDNELIRLGSNESRILLLLCEKPSEIVSRNELHDFVWRRQGFEVDDSSLTQAISTLRKLLNDSTKSPMYVKTVPKRGYQLICSVERVTPLLSGNEEPQEEPTEASLETETPAQEPANVDAPTVQTEPAPITRSSPVKVSTSWGTKLLLLAALLLPICVLQFTNPAESEFRQLGVYDKVAVKTPLNHPDLTEWYPSIEQCVKSYNETHTGDKAPIEVIATGGQNSQLVLNYIHSLANSGESVTLRIVTEQTDLGTVCN